MSLIISLGFIMPNLRLCCQSPARPSLFYTNWMKVRYFKSCIRKLNVSSSSDDLLRERKLNTKQNLKKSGTTWLRPTNTKAGEEVIYGIHPVKLALEAKMRELLEVFIKEDLLEQPSDQVQAILHESTSAGTPVSSASKKQLHDLSGGRPHQGVCLLATKMRYVPLDNRDLANAETAERPLLWLLLDSILDPMNLGAVLRSSYFLGVDRVLVTKRNTCSPSAVVSKASAGVLEICPVFSVSQPADLLQDLRGRGWAVAGSGGEADPGDLGSPRVDNTGEMKAVNTQTFTFDRHTLLVVGNEGRGISPEIWQHCNYRIFLASGRPLPPGLDSLNVSVATALLVHSILRQRLV